MKRDALYRLAQQRYQEMLNLAIDCQNWHCCVLAEEELRDPACVVDPARYETPCEILALNDEA